MLDAKPVPAVMQPVADARRDALGAPEDGRSIARRRCDNVRAGLLAACEEKHGRVPSLESHEQPTPAAQQAHARLEDYERDYIAAAGMGAGRETRTELEERFHGAVLEWLRIATAGWLPKTEHERRQRAEEARAYR